MSTVCTYSMSIIAVFLTSAETAKTAEISLIYLAAIDRCFYIS